MSYFLGIDVSTTGAKALIIDEQGSVHRQPHHRVSTLHAEAVVERARSARLVEWRVCQYQGRVEQSEPYG